MNWMMELKSRNKVITQGPKEHEGRDLAVRSAWTISINVHTGQDGTGALAADLYNGFHDANPAYPLLTQ